MHIDSFVEMQQDVSLHFSNIAVSSRNTALGTTLVISDRDPKATLEMIIELIVAKNAVAVYLGPELTKSDKLVKFIHAIDPTI